jgi:mycofactocin system glycosyltransferase
MVALPSGTRLMADPSLQPRQDGRVLMGGVPLRFIRLSPAGSRLVRSWLEGEPVGPQDAAQKLARRLLDAGMVHPQPPTGPLTARVPLTVIIPVRDDPQGLEATLQGLPRDAAAMVVVVDDASARPVELRCPCPAPWQLVRRAAAGGPGTARQTGLELTSTPLVAFVDAGVRIGADQLSVLARWFEDPDVVAVGPRVASRSGHGALAAYERTRSPLDLGPVPSAVGPGRRVAYLPTAVLLARRAELEAAGGFDPGLRYGEDVDLVWRLAARGTIRYDPSVVAEHPPRLTLRAFLRQRFSYGTAAAPLARRHGRQVAPARLSGWSLACWALMAVGRPGTALLTAAGTALALDRKLAPVLGEGRAASARLAFRGHWAAGGGLADAAAREWWPVTLAAAVVGWRRQAMAAAVWALVRRARAGSGPIPDQVRDLALGSADNLAYGAGVWAGAWRERSIGALLPQLTSWPGRTTERHTAIER